MAVITVSPDSLLLNVKKMEELLNDVVNQEAEASNVVGDLGASWSGQDYTLFLAHYANTMTESSTYGQTYQMIINYLNFVRSAASLYSEAISAAESEAAQIGQSGFSAQSTEAQSVLNGVCAALGITK